MTWLCTPRLAEQRLAVNVSYLRRGFDAPIAVGGEEAAVGVATECGGESGEEVLGLAEAGDVPAALLRHGREGQWDPYLHDAFLH